MFFFQNFYYPKVTPLKPLYQITQRNIVIPAEFKNKVFVGYQAWFNIPNDGNNRGWTHYGNAQLDRNNIVFEMWPNVSEYATGTQETPYFLNDSNTKARLFSSFDQNVIDKHFEWMQTYNIHGAFLQWFLVDNSAYRLEIAKRVLKAAEKYQRNIVIMFDISGTKNRTDLGCSTLDCLKLRWKSVVDSGITNSPFYLKHNTKPLVGIWGLGYTHNDNINATQAIGFLNWIHNPPLAEIKYQAAVFGGVPTYWRTRDPGSDALTEIGWKTYYDNLDIISPWSIGRFNSEASLKNFMLNRIDGDIAYAKANGKKYLPVIFPGFSWRNLTLFNPNMADDPLNQIPRMAGQFLWSQAREYARRGLNGFYLAMFDEVDEGTAIFKTASNSSMAPSDNDIVTLKLNADGVNLPSDWYLQVTKYISDSIQNPWLTSFISSELPIKKMQFNSGNLTIFPGDERKNSFVTLKFNINGAIEIYDKNLKILWRSPAAGIACLSGSVKMCKMVFQVNGNLVLYKNINSDGTGGVPYWNTMSNGHTLSKIFLSEQSPYLRITNSGGYTVFASSNNLTVNGNELKLLAGQWIVFGTNRLVMQRNRNLVIYDSKGAAKWSSNTRVSSTSNCLAQFQADGNLVIYEISNGITHAIWSTNTGGSNLFTKQLNLTNLGLSIKNVSL
jgi:hypothetical protein